MRARHAIVLLAALPLLATAQVIPEGATPDEAIRAWGSPRSRSAAKGREIWLYAEHQAIFEQGRLTALVALPSDGGNVAWQKGATAAVPSSAPAASSAARERTIPSGNRAAGSGAAPDAMIVKRDGGKLILRSPERSVPPPPPPVKESGGLVGPFLTALILLGLGAGGVRYWYRRPRSLSNGPGWAGRKSSVVPTPTAQPLPAPPVPPPTRSFASESRPPSLVDWELTPELLGTMEWKRFEMLVQRYFSANGLRAMTHLVGADGGIELFLFRGRTTHPFSYVQCRSWGNQTADVRVVRELFAILAEHRVYEGILITTGTFTPDAEKFGRQNRITLLSGTEFLTRFNRLPHMVRARILTDVTAGDFTTPSCPRCSLKLVPREGGPDGAAAWACRRYPQCRYTLTPRADMAAGAVSI